MVKPPLEWVVSKAASPSAGAADFQLGDKRLM
jgi:hypothetical protein